jgi:hypothetical protein
MASPLKGLPQALSCTNQTCSSSNVRKITYVIENYVPPQVVDATPSELKALFTGGVYEPKKTYSAFGDPES